VDIGDVIYVSHVNAYTAVQLHGCMAAKDAHEV